jgi:hypothetical protein
MPQAQFGRQVQSFSAKHRGKVRRGVSGCSGLRFGHETKNCSCEYEFKSFISDQLRVWVHAAQSTKVLFSREEAKEEDEE